MNVKIDVEISLEDIEYKLEKHIKDIDNVDIESITQEIDPIIRNLSDFDKYKDVEFNCNESYISINAYNADEFINSVLLVCYKTYTVTLKCNSFNYYSLQETIEDMFLDIYKKVDANKFIDLDYKSIEVY